MQPKSKHISYTQEICRKLVHLSSLWVVVLYHFYDRDVMLNVLIPFTLVVLIADGARRCSGKICPMCETVIGYFLRNHEREKLSGASYMMVSALILVLLFPKTITMVSFSILIISDSAAALIGRAFGTPRFGDKSPAGTMAFLSTAVAISFFFYYFYELSTLFLWSALAASVIAALVEALSDLLKLDDNFTIPLSVATTMLSIQWLAGAL